MDYVYYYCPKCGMITCRLRGEEGATTTSCRNCGYSVKFEINPKWEINEDAHNRIYNQMDYGEKTKKECDDEWREYCRPFVEEVVAKRPEFSRKDYEHIPIFEEEQSRRYKKIEEEVANMKTTSSSSYSPTITCPYCKSSNTKKISTMSRMFSGGLFGLGSKKIGKQWHCNSCGSDF